MGLSSCKKRRQRFLMPCKHLPLSLSIYEVTNLHHKWGFPFFTSVFFMLKFLCYEVFAKQKTKKSDRVHACLVRVWRSFVGSWISKRLTFMPLWPHTMPRCFPMQPLPGCLFQCSFTNTGISYIASSAQGVGGQNSLPVHPQMEAHCFRRGAADAG